jgi:hypothetical protein
MLYVFSSRFIPLEQVLSAISLWVAAIANFPVANYFSRISVVVLDGIMCGFLSSFNLISLLCFVQKSNVQSLRFLLPISSLFLMAQSMLVITSDTNLLARYFENNSVVWVFFLSMTVISSAGYGALLIRNLTMAFCRSRKTRNTLFIAYSLAAFITLLPLVAELMLFIVTGAGNFTVNFCSHYLGETLLSFLYSDLHWPLVTAEMGEPLVEDRLDLPDCDIGSDFIAEDVQLCM